MVKITLGTRENPVRFSYANVFEAVSINGSEPRFSVSIIIPKTDGDAVKMVQDAVQRVIEEYADKFEWERSGSLKIPLRDGDVERGDDDAYAGSYFINASSKIMPGIVDRDRKPITDQSEFYSGCYGRVSLIFYGFRADENQGIGAGLVNIMKTADGEHLSRSTPEEDFGEEDILG